MSTLAFVPFSIASGSAKSAVIDIGPSNIIVGIMIHGAWTAAKISFEGYVQDTATKTSPADPTSTLETGAIFDPIKDGNGTQFSWGNGTDISSQQVVPAPTASIIAPRFIKVVSGTSASLVTQNQAVSGYVLTRL